MQDMKNRQNTENWETTMWVNRCEACVTKAKKSIPQELRYKAARMATLRLVLHKNIFPIPLYPGFTTYIAYKSCTNHTIYTI